MDKKEQEPPQPEKKTRPIKKRQATATRFLTKKVKR